jgi:hypothetical protein
MCCVLAPILSVATGCGSERPFPMHQVSGTVRYEDGSPIPSESIIIRFEPLTPPLDQKTHPRPGKAKVDPADGSFQNVTTYSYGDGIIRGRHKVLLSERLGQDSLAKPLIPETYRDPATTPLEVDSSDSPFDLKVSRPDQSAEGKSD